jgi:hypothetical protein
MAYAIGLVLGLATILLGRWVGFDRDRAFYPTILIVVASYYVLFAAIGASSRVLAVEMIFMTVFVAAIVAVGAYLASVALRAKPVTVR